MPIYKVIVRHDSGERDAYPEILEVLNEGGYGRDAKVSVIKGNGLLINSSSRIIDPSTLTKIRSLEGVLKVRLQK